MSRGCQRDRVFEWNWVRESTASPDTKYLRTYQGNITGSFKGCAVNRTSGTLVVSTTLYMSLPWRTAVSSHSTVKSLSPPGWRGILPPPSSLLLAKSHTRDMCEYIQAKFLSSSAILKQTWAINELKERGSLFPPPKNDTKQDTSSDEENEAASWSLCPTGVSCEENKFLTLYYGIDWLLGRFNEGKRIKILLRAVTGQVFILKLISALQDFYLLLSFCWSWSRWDVEDVFTINAKSFFLSSFFLHLISRTMEGGGKKHFPFKKWGLRAGDLGKLGQPKTEERKKFIL